MNRIREKRKIAVSGATGFIGRHVVASLGEQGYEVVPLTRRDFAPGAEDQLAWLVAECEGVVNLAGAPIDRRWTRAWKEELWASRVDVTRRLVEAVNRSERTRVFVSASAVGRYPSVGCYDEEDDARGQGFLSRLCEAWEAQALQARVRTVVTRFGVVLAPDGGAFPQLARPAQAGVAVVPGSGLQAFSWIDLADLLRAQAFVLAHEEMQGIYNFTAPEKYSMRDVVRELAHRFHSRMTIHVPAFALRLRMGEAASALLDGQCAVPRRLLEAGFRFESPALGDFLQRL